MRDIARGSNQLFSYGNQSSGKLSGPCRRRRGVIACGRRLARLSAKGGRCTTRVDRVRRRHRRGVRINAEVRVLALGTVHDVRLIDEDAGCLWVGTTKTRHAYRTNVNLVRVHQRRVGGRGTCRMFPGTGPLPVQLKQDCSHLHSRFLHAGSGSNGKLPVPSGAASIS